MKVIFRSSFLRDLKKIHDSQVLIRIKKALEEVESASSFTQINHISKMSGSENFYRIRLGEYRIGLVLAGDTLEFIRCLHRREIYHYFP